jgi:alpha-D-ribose 1-methylphosphonate 5-triphosphate synthase subunit PhnH
MGDFDVDALLDQVCQRVIEVFLGCHIVLLLVAVLFAAGLVLSHASASLATCRLFKRRSKSLPSQMGKIALIVRVEKMNVAQNATETGNGTEARGIEKTDTRRTGIEALQIGTGTAVKTTGTGIEKGVYQLGRVPHSLCTAVG